MGCSIDSTRLETHENAVSSGAIFNDYDILVLPATLLDGIIQEYQDTEKNFVIYKRGDGIYFMGAEFIDGEWVKDYQETPLNLLTSVYITKVSHVTILDGDSFSYTELYEGLHPKAPGEKTFFVKITDKGLFIADSDRMIGHRKGGKESKRAAK